MHQGGPTWSNKDIINPPRQHVMVPMLPSYNYKSQLLILLHKPAPLPSHYTITNAQTQDNKEPTLVPLFEPDELTSWSFYHPGITEFISTFLFIYVNVSVMEVSKSDSKCATIGI
ncbi:hypothetical protein ACS0TY_008385 [Phlomoides rotata]